MKPPQDDDRPTGVGRELPSLSSCEPPAATQRSEAPHTRILYTRMQDSVNGDVPDAGARRGFL
jgi:hypothetical protein